MDTKLLALAAFGAALALPASAGPHHAVGIGIPDAKSPAMMGAPGLTRDQIRCPGVRQPRVGGRSSCAFYGDGWPYADGEWAYSNNRSWDSDSYNDWWHDRPDRAFPRWVQEQRGGPCQADRMWWSGSGWHC